VLSAILLLSLLGLALAIPVIGLVFAVGAFALLGPILLAVGTAIPAIGGLLVRQVGKGGLPALWPRPRQQHLW
jgi:hypothetical protein